MAPTRIVWRAGTVGGALVGASATGGAVAAVAARVALAVGAAAGAGAAQPTVANSKRASGTRRLTASGPRPEAVAGRVALRRGGEGGGLPGGVARRIEPRLLHAAAVLTPHDDRERGLIALVYLVVDGVGEDPVHAAGPGGDAAGALDLGVVRPAAVVGALVAVDRLLALVDAVDRPHRAVVVDPALVAGGVVHEGDDESLVGIFVQQVVARIAREGQVARGEPAAVGEQRPHSVGGARQGRAGGPASAPRGAGGVERSG